MAARLELPVLAVEAAALAGAVRGALGPRGGRALLVRRGRAAALTRDGRALLEALGPQPHAAGCPRRVMAACACSLRAVTGDGAKAFVVLLAAVLGGLRAAGLRAAGLRRALRDFEARVLQRAVARGLRRHLVVLPTGGAAGALLEPAGGATAALRETERDDLGAPLPGRGAKVLPPGAESSAEALLEPGVGSLEALVEPYLCGRVGPSERRLLAGLCGQLCRRCGALAPGPLHLLRRRFAQLHLAVPGLPVRSSRVLPGILLCRDFAARCPAQGHVRALLVTQPLRAALAGPDVEFMVVSEGQYGTSLQWVSRRTEDIMKHLQSNNIKLLLSSVKQGEEVLYYAKLYSISVVECLSEEEVSFICEITGVSPYTPFSDNLHGEITDAAVATFCQPLLLGSKRYIHVGFTSTCALQPHCLVLCGPVDAVNEQHAAALQGALTMLQQLFKSVDLVEECKAEGERQNEAIDVSSWRSSATQKQVLPESISCNSNQVPEQELKTHRDEIETQTVDPHLRGSENPAGVQIDLQIPSHPILHIKELSVTTEGDGSSGDAQELHANCEHPGDVHENHKRDLLVGNQRNCSSAVSAAHSADIVTACKHLDVGKDLEKMSCNVVPFKHTQNYSNCLIEAGSVLPVGGYFEILLHYYIQYYAKQCQQSELTVISNVVADALLSIPKALYGTAERNGFTKFYLKTINALRKNEPLHANEKGLESVYCKYQLVISVLHCITELLSIDLIIAVKRPLQKNEDCDSEDDF